MFVHSRYCLRYMLIFLLIVHTDAQADSASWLSTFADQNWANNANWTNPFPNGIGEVAAFAGYGATVDSTQDITVGTLYLDTPGSISIAFTNNHTLTFDKSTSTNQSNIFLASGQTHSLDTPVILKSNLTIQAGTSSSLAFNQPISEAGVNFSLTVMGDPDTHINFNAANTYTGDTLIRCGYADLNGPNNVANIPANISVFGSGNLKHGAGSLNNYAPGCVMSLIGGTVEMNNTDQTISSLYMTNSADIFSSVSPSILRITGTNPAILIGDNSSINIDTIVLINGGIINNDSTRPGEGFFFGLGAPSGTTTIDLNGNSPVTLNADNNGLQGSNEFDLDFVNVAFTNGSLVKTGSGTVNFDGTTTLTDLTIQNGTVQIGRQGFLATISGPATITTTSSASFQGFGTVGTPLNPISVMNSQGFVIPGSSFTIGTMTINGSYTQAASAQLVIQAFQSTFFSQLVVNEGAVSLAGNLFFLTYPFGTPIVAGDELVVIDNTGGTGITGTFDNLIATAPSGLSASLIYSPTQVKIRFDECEGSLLPPTDLRGEQIINRFAIQQDIINALAWDKSPTPEIVGYKIYQNGREIGIVSAQGPLIFADHNQQANVPSSYSITSLGQESAPVTIIVP